MAASTEPERHRGARPGGKAGGHADAAGVGLFLIKNMVDEVRVSGNPDHHTVELVMLLKGRTMPAKHLEARVRQERGGTVLDLRGEINGVAQEALNAAYAEAEAKEPGAIILNFGG